MTVEELSQLFWLNIEIEELNQNLLQLENSGENFAMSSIREIQSKLEDRKAKAMMQRALIEEFISSVDDSRQRLIIQYRYIDLLSWPQIAHRIGSGILSADSLRIEHNRFLAQKGITA